MKKMSGDIFLLYIHLYHKWRSYDIWFPKYKVQQTEIFAILGNFFCPFSPLTSWKNKILPLRKNTWRYYNFTHVYQKCTNHMMYGSWDIECNRQNFLSFWTILCPFTKKNQNFEKNKKDVWIYYYFTQVWHKWQSYDQGIIQTK